MKSGRQEGGQDLSERVEHGMGCMLRARTKWEDGKNLGTGIDGQLQDEAVAARPRA